MSILDHLAHLRALAAVNTPTHPTRRELDILGVHTAFAAEGIQILNVDLTNGTVTIQTLGAAVSLSEAYGFLFVNVQSSITRLNGQSYTTRLHGFESLHDAVVHVIRYLRLNEV